MALLIHQRLRRAPSSLLLLSVILLVALNAGGAAPLVLGLRKRFTQVPAGPLLDLPTSSHTDGRHRSTLTSFNPAGYVQLGEYFISLSLGTPAQTFDAVIDTGSGVIHVPCAVPPDVSPPVPTFNFSASTTLTRLYCSSNEREPSATECIPICDRSRLIACTCAAADSESGRNACSYGLAYGDGSGAHGFLFNDVVYLSDDNRTAARLELGCATNFSQGMFEPRSPYFAGIDWQEGSLLSQLTAAGITDDTFSMCLGDAGVTANWNDTNTSDPTAANGLLVLGTAPPLTSPVRHFVSTQAMNYTAWNSDPSSPFIIIPGLNLELMSLAVGAVNDTSSNLTNLLAPNTTYPAIPDSGTSYAQFPAMLAESLILSLEAAFSAAAATANASVLSSINASAGSLYVLISFPTATSPSQLDELLPPLVFQFSPASPVTISLPPSRYLKLYAYPFTWVFIISAGPANSQVILGNEIIRNWYIQATKSTLQVNISIVDSCNNLTFLSTDVPSPGSSTPQPHSATGSGSKRVMHAHADAGGAGDPVPIPHDASHPHVRASLRRPHGHLL